MTRAWVAALAGFVLAMLPPTAAAQDGMDRLYGVPSWLYWLLPGIVAITLLGLGLLVLLKGQPIIYNRVFFALCLSSAIKSFSEGSLIFIQITGTVQSLFSPMEFVNRTAAFLYAPIFLWFVLVFPRPIVPLLKKGVLGAFTLLLAVPFIIDLIAPFGLQAWFNVFVTLLAIASLGLLVYHAWETDSDEERVRLRLLSITFAMLVFTTIVITLLTVAAAGAGRQGRVSTQQDYEALSIIFGTLISPILEIAGIILVMYAILKYQLLGVDVIIKRITRGGLFAITIGFTFVIVSNSVEQVFQVTLLAGVPLDFLVAGFISTLMMYPVQKFTERIANKMFPMAGSAAPDHLAQRRMEIYEAQLRYALLDGELKQKELTMLQALKESIGLNLAELEAVIKKFPGAEATKLLQPMPTGA